MIRDFHRVDAIGQELHDRVGDHTQGQGRGVVGLIVEQRRNTDIIEVVVTWRKL